MRGSAIIVGSMHVGPMRVGSIRVGPPRWVRARENRRSRTCDGHRTNSQVRTGEREYGDCRWTTRSGIYAQGSEPERREAFGLPGKECRPDFLPARLESRLLERACLLRKRPEAV